MASIFDLDPDDLPPRSQKEEITLKRSKHRESITPSDYSKGKRTLMSMVESAFDCLEDAVKSADFPTAIKAAQIILDRSGFGPKSTVDVNTTSLDLSTLSREELAERASRISHQLRSKDQKTIDITPSSIN